MAIAWSALRDEQVRVFLDDVAKNTWSDAELLLYCRWALDDFTLWCPLAATMTLARDTASFTLPNDFYQVNLVEWTYTDYYRKFLEEVSRRPGFEFPSSEVDDESYPVGYWIEGDTLYLGRTAEEDFTLHYWAYYPIPTGDASSITVPRWGRQALLFYIVAMALLRQSIGHAMVRQWNTRVDSGRPLDEPLLPEVKFLLEQYRQILQDHTAERADWNVYWEGRS